jgi:hypothetical protein
MIYELAGRQRLVLESFFLVLVSLISGAQMLRDRVHYTNPGMLVIQVGRHGT